MPFSFIVNEEMLFFAYSEGWELKAVNSFSDCYLDREIKKTRAEKKAEQSPEYLEFKGAYPRNDGITAPAFIKKYDALVSEGKHSEIMDSLKKWVKFWQTSNLICGRPLHDVQYVPHASTWINGKRYETSPNEVFVPEAKRREMEISEAVSKIPEAFRKKVAPKLEQYLRDHPNREADGRLISEMVKAHG